MRTPSRTPSDVAGVSLSDAAVQLGISPDAARKRLDRGTLRGEKRSGRWRVFLESDASPDAGPDTPSDADRTPSDAASDSASDLVVALRDEVAFLRSELAVPTRVQGTGFINR